MKLPTTTTRPMVVQVMSASFCGTSLLNLFLAPQRDVFGLGEAWHVYGDSGKKAYCKLCRVYAPDCPFYADIDRSAFYMDCARKSGAKVLVDTSKIPSVLLAARDERLRYRTVVLSKLPHEFAKSWVEHKKDVAVRDAFREYVRYYRVVFQAVGGGADGTLAGGYRTLSYRELVLNTSSAIGELCAHCGIPFDPQALGNWYATNSHVVGGNGAVAAQMDGRKGFFEEDAKYRGRKWEIFLDDAWKGDADFVRQCREEYEKSRNELAPLLASLGHPCVEEILDELTPDESAAVATGTGSPPGTTSRDRGTPC